jgi:IS5 family transposase
MITKPKNTSQLGFYSSFEEQLDQRHPLYILANAIHWQVFEDAFTKHYSQTMGAPAKPIRLMVSLLILKQLRNLSDESMVEQWSENSYYQYFSGEKYFASQPPCTATELVEFRKRVGEEGIELIFKESIRINGKDGQKDILSADTTVQEKNIAFPTDDKLYKKIISKCQDIAEKENIELRQSYRQTVKKLSLVQRMKRRKGGNAIARKASKKIKTIAGRLTRELERKLTPQSLQKWGSNLLLFQKVLSQKKDDSNKIYSLHEPGVKCFSKGKEHKKYEFGSKVSLLITQKTGVIVGAMNFSENIHDSKTLPDALQQHERLTGIKAKEVFVDRGYPGPKQIGDTQIHLPKPNKNITLSQRKKHSRRAAIEPTIGHLKHDYRMIKNFLKGNFGDAVNVLLAVSAMNFKRMMNLWENGKNSLAQFFSLLLHQLLEPAFFKYQLLNFKNRLFED